ncbi:MAG: hypothetical protein BRC52_07550 [Cyanobacteria bacterium SW_5_48_44]|nr:MAG: hypothetical protein BRC52_07550 [Cyanobacteria bacterium SW_5_48_44]
MNRSADELPVGERADGPFREMIELMEQPLLQVLQRREVASPEPLPGWRCERPPGPAAASGS